MFTTNQYVKHAFIVIIICFICFSLVSTSSASRPASDLRRPGPIAPARSPADCTLSRETLINIEWRLYSLRFELLPSEGYPFRFLDDGTIETKNLAFMRRWKIESDGTVTLRDAKGVEAYRFTFDPQHCILKIFECQDDRSIPTLIGPKGTDVSRYLETTCPARFRTSSPTVPRQTIFGIYLFADPIDARTLAQNRGQWKKLPLSRVPVISEADIVSYDFSKHAMRLRPEALKRLPRPPVAGTPFVVVVNGERIYPGAFYTSASSIPFALPVIVVDRAGQSQDSGADVLLIERAYPPQMASGNDLRSDVRVKDALGKLKKLVAP